MTRVPLKLLKSLLGRMARQSRAGRRFINRLLETVQGPFRPTNTLITLSNGQREDLSWWVRYGVLLNTRAVISLPPMPRKAVIVTDGRGSSSEGPPSIGGLCYPLKEYFSTVVADEFHDSPVHVIEAVALVVAVRLWIECLGGQSLVPIGCDNMAVVAAVNRDRSKEPSLSATARLVWSMFRRIGSTCHLRYVSTDLNASDGVSRLNSAHTKFLSDSGWKGVSVDSSYCSLVESDSCCQVGIRQSSTSSPLGSVS